MVSTGGFPLIVTSITHSQQNATDPYKRIVSNSGPINFASVREMEFIPDFTDATF